MRRCWIIGVLILPVSMTLLGAQGRNVPKRPRLDSRADTNDWEAYYDYGVRYFQKIPGRANDAFYWASRLAPWSADPLYALWAIFHYRRLNDFERYLDDDDKVRDDPAVQRTDSMLRTAYLRNPFLHRTLEMVLYDALPGTWSNDPVTRAWFAYLDRKFELARKELAIAIASNRAKHYRYRHMRAVLFVAEKQYDSALVELSALLDHARRLDTTKVVRIYESKAFYEYAIGRLEVARENRTAARQAFERALTEDLAYGPAHVWLGTLADEDGNGQAALVSYAQAVELIPSDAVYRYQYAVALLKADRLTEALEQLTRAIALEPYYAEPYVLKATAHERLSQPDSARTAYRAYLDRAARNAPNRLLATQRLAALASATSSR